MISFELLAPGKPYGWIPATHFTRFILYHFLHVFGGGIRRAATNPPALSGRNERGELVPARKRRAAGRGATRRSATSSTTLNRYHFLKCHVLFEPWISRSEVKGKYEKHKKNYSVDDQPEFGKPDGRR